MEAALIVLAVVAALLVGVVIYLATRRGESEGWRGDLAGLQAKALQQNSERFLDLAETRLKTESARGEEQIKARKEEIEKSFKAVGDSLQSLRDFVQAVDTKRSDSILRLATVTTEQRKAIEALSETTGRLDQALAGGQSRGQWGERMADDLLRVAGFVEDVNYRKNKQIEAGTTRPDFTFLLPQKRVLHMDVKFPLAGYLDFLQADSDVVREAAKKQFLIDVRQRLKEVTTRDYIDPANGTLDYMLVFIPNEQVYGFIHQHDPRLLDEALQQRVVLCAPLTLFAVLAVIRQSVENFRLGEHTNEILAALGGFNKQWENFKGAMEDVGKRIAQTQTAYDTLTGTRTRQLDRQVTKVERLRREAGIEAAAIAGGEEEPAELAARVGDDG